MRVQVVVCVRVYQLQVSLVRGPPHGMDLTMEGRATPCIMF